MKIDHDVTYKKYRAAYLERVKKKNRTKIWAYYVNRPIAFWPTLLFLKLSLSPNLATAISGIAVIVGALLLAMGGFWFILSGIVVTGLWLVFDSVDGSIARYREECSIYGELFDAVCGYLMASMTFLCLGIGVYRTGGSPVFIALGAVISIAALFPRVIYQKMLTYSKDGAKYREILELEKKEGTGFKFLAVTTVSNFADQGGFVLPLMFLSTVFDLLGYYLMFYAVLYSVVAVISVRKIMNYVKINYK